MTSFSRQLSATPALAVFLFLFSCAAGQERAPGPDHGEPPAFQDLPRSASREKIATEPFRVFVQPYRESRILVEGEPVAARLIQSDKTLGLLQFDAPRFQDGLGFRLAIEHEGYRTAYRVMTAGDARTTQLMVLDQATSAHEFFARWSVGGQPKSVTFLDARRVVLPLMLGDGADVVNILTGEVTRVSPPAKWARHMGFVETVVLRDENEFWVSQMYTHTVHVFDLGTLAYKETISLKGGWVKVLCYDQARHRVYASNWNTGDISLIDARTHAVTGRIRVGGVPRGMQISNDGRLLRIAQFGGKNDTDGAGRVVEYDLENDRELRRFGVPGSKRHIVNTDKNFFVSDMSFARVEAYSGETGEFLQYIQVYSKPNTMDLSPDRKRLYVSCRGPNHPTKGYLHRGLEMGRVYTIDTETLTVSEFWEGGNQPTGLAVSPDGAFVVSSDFLDHSIRVYRRLKN